MLVVDNAMDKQIFDLKQGVYRVTLSGRDRGLDLAVDSLVAIPYEDWSLNYIQPQLKCVRRDKQ